MNILILAAAVAATPSAPVPVPPMATTVPAAPLKTVDPAALASARKLIGMLHLDQTIDRMMGSLVPVMTDAVLGELDHNEATQATMQKMESQPNGRARLTAIFAEEFLKSFRMRYPALLDGAAREYAAVFTATELDQVIAFYSSGTGAKFLVVSPQLQQSVGAASSQLGREAGMEAGLRAMQRAGQELIPSDKTVS
ncbi:MAG TPA: DUF2059 domain-containing protein [Sphingomonas sp.]|uniref:DUF2059 domain-containing protein n=1 Tax=Sphingomonas sp. TaxID=28214 RepID=UPI002CFB2ACE|nr:DUF2059 domain-containing protein [Sphingomonas sp.]HMI20088.1 DUF2059 domain-containing protein [Sphingomonas sp.]